MAYFIVIGCVVTAWALLRVLGAERETRLHLIQGKIKSELAEALEKAAQAAEEAKKNARH